MARTKVSPEAAAAVAAIEGVGRGAANRPSGPLPFVEPKLPRSLAAVIELVLPERGFDIEAEYSELEKHLQIEGALTPQVVKENLNQAERRALRAHRLYVAAKLIEKGYGFDCAEAIGAMRQAATDELQKEKDRGERNKSITEADVRDRAATMYPDEWARVNDGAERAKRTVEHLEQFSDLWKGRRFSLAGLLGDGR